MNAYTVYHYDFNRKVREPVGMVLERRKLDRGSNFDGLLKLAKKIYPPPPDSHIVISLE